MKDLQTIEAESAEAAAKAAKQNRKPNVLFSEDTAFDDIRSAPFLGDYTPKGWVSAIHEDYDDVLPSKVREGDGADCALTLFADASGFGDDGEPALTASELEEVAQALVRKAAERGVTVGVGIEQVGQFQVFLRVFEKGA